MHCELCAETDRKSITNRLWFCKIYSRLILFSIYNDNTEKKDIIITSIRICQRSDRWWTSQETRSVSVWHKACGSASQPLFLNERVRQTELQLLQSALHWSGKGLSRQGTMTLISYEKVTAEFRNHMFPKCQALLLLTITKTVKNINITCFR